MLSQTKDIPMHIAVERSAQTGLYRFEGGHERQVASIDFSRWLEQRTLWKT